VWSTWLEKHVYLSVTTVQTIRYSSMFLKADDLVHVADDLAGNVHVLT